MFSRAAFTDRGAIRPSRREQLHTNQQHGRDVQRKDPFGSGNLLASPQSRITLRQPNIFRTSKLFEDADSKVIVHSTEFVFMKDFISKS